MADDHLTLVNYYDRMFDQSLASQYQLSIRLDPGGLSFSVYSPTAGKYLGLESVRFSATFPSSGSTFARKIFSEQLAIFLAKHPWLCADFKTICIIVHSNQYTLVPSALYDPAIKEDYLTFAHSPAAGSVFLGQKLVSADSWLVYAIDPLVYAVLIKYFPSAKQLHHAGAILETLLPVYRHAELQDQIFVNVKKGSVDIVILKEGKLRYCNSFKWKVPDDLVYFLIFVMDQLALNPERVPVFLMGYIEPEERLHELILRYIRNVGFVKPFDDKRTGFSIPDTDIHKYYDLLNPGLCGS